MTAEDFTREKCLNTINKVKDANLRGLLSMAIRREFDFPSIYKTIAMCGERFKEVVYTPKEHLRAILGSFIGWGLHPPINSIVGDKIIGSWSELYTEFISGGIDIIYDLDWETILNHLESKLQ